MGGDAGELGRAARTSAMSHPPCALAPLQQPLMARSPHGLGPPLHLGTEIVQGMWGGLGGRGKLLSLRQKDAGQHFIHNHLNVFAVFKGCLGSGVKRFHLSSRLHVGEGGELVPAGSCCAS